MDSTTRHSIIPFGPMASFAIAIITLGFTSIAKIRNSADWGAGSLSLSMVAPSSDIHATSTLPKIHIFNMHDVEATHEQSAMHMTNHARTNRTVWHLVNSSHLHAGFQRVEADAWIPSHSYETESLLVVVSGKASVYDEDGFATQVKQGSMIHIAPGSSHAIHNTQEDLPLLLMWTLPARVGFSNKFQFPSNKFTNE